MKDSKINIALEEFYEYFKNDVPLSDNIPMVHHTVTHRASVGENAFWFEIDKFQDVNISSEVYLKMNGWLSSNGVVFYLDKVDSEQDPFSIHVHLEDALDVQNYNYELDKIGI